MGPFRVDLLVDQRIIVEANGPDHYFIEVNEDGTCKQQTTLNEDFKRNYFLRVPEYKYYGIEIKNLMDNAGRFVKTVLNK